MLRFSDVDRRTRLDFDLSVIPSLLRLRLSTQLGAKLDRLTQRDLDVLQRISLNGRPLLPQLADDLLSRIGRVARSGRVDCLDPEAVLVALVQPGHVNAGGVVVGDLRRHPAGKIFLEFAVERGGRLRSRSCNFLAFFSFALKIIAFKYFCFITINKTLN